MCWRVDRGGLLILLTSVAKPGEINDEPTQKYNYSGTKDDTDSRLDVSEPTVAVRTASTRKNRAKKKNGIQNVRVFVAVALEAASCVTRGGALGLTGTHDNSGMDSRTADRPNKSLRNSDDNGGPSEFDGTAAQHHTSPTHLTTTVLHDRLLYPPEDDATLSHINLQSTSTTRTRPFPS